MNQNLTWAVAAVAGASLAGNVWLGCRLSSASALAARQKDEIAKLQAETTRLDNELWKVGRGLDFKKPFGVEPGALIDDNSLTAKFMDTEGTYVGFKPADLVGERDSKRIAEVSGFMDRTWETKAEAEKAASALRAWMDYWMAGSDLGWSVEVNSPDKEWKWRVRFRVEKKDLADKIRARERQSK